MKEKAITFEDLSMEYLAWKDSYGDGRNENDIRFGQYIHNKYDMSSCNFGADDFINKADGFYSEKTQDAYEIISNRLLTQTL